MTESEPVLIAVVAIPNATHSYIAPQLSEDLFKKRISTRVVTNGNVCLLLMQQKVAMVLYSSMSLGMGKTAMKSLEILYSECHARANYTYIKLIKFQFFNSSHLLIKH